MGIVLVADKEVFIAFYQLFQTLDFLRLSLDLLRQERNGRVDRAGFRPGIPLRRVCRLDGLVTLQGLARPGVPQSPGRLGDDLVPRDRARPALDDASNGIDVLVGDPDAAGALS